MKFLFEMKAFGLELSKRYRLIYIDIKVMKYICY